MTLLHVQRLCLAHKWPMGPPKPSLSQTGGGHIKTSSAVEKGPGYHQNPTPTANVRVSCINPSKDLPQPYFAFRSLGATQGGKHGWKALTDPKSLGLMLPLGGPRKAIGKAPPIPPM